VIGNSRTRRARLAVTTRPAETGWLQGHLDVKHLL